LRILAEDAYSSPKNILIKSSIKYKEHNVKNNIKKKKPKVYFTIVYCLTGPSANLLTSIGKKETIAIFLRRIASLEILKATPYKPTSVDVLMRDIITASTRTTKIFKKPINEKVIADLITASSYLRGDKKLNSAIVFEV
tara:strand:+ start:71 stop:487 length:417 start_codon:yes stop_codon:yes gene_type:complete